MLNGFLQIYDSYILKHELTYKYIENVILFIFFYLMFFYNLNHELTYKYIENVIKLNL
jgi:hypothetical protein